MMNPRRLLVAASVGVAALLASGCATTPAPSSITDTAARTPALSTLARLVGEAGLADTLRGTGPFTVFAPTDDAFKALRAKTLEELSRDKERLKALLTYHVIPGKVMAVDVKPGNAKTANGANVALSKAGMFVAFDEALVTRADVQANNGVIHLIDKVIVPPAPRR